MTIVWCHSEDGVLTESYVEDAIMGVRVYIHTTFSEIAAKAAYVLSGKKFVT